jgi:carbamoyl-phosphate synthase large subunit
VIATIEDYTERLTRALKIQGPFNIQFLVKDGSVYIIELNLRASRSFPYTSKAVGIPLIKIAAKVMLGKSLRELNALKKPQVLHRCVKTPMFSFMRIKGADPVLGVEMTSTGEVACLDYDFATALIKALTASGLSLSTPGKPILFTVREEDRDRIGDIARRMQKAGYSLLATRGTARFLSETGVKVSEVGKISDGKSDIINGLIKREIGMVINMPSPLRKAVMDDEYTIRRIATEFLIPVITQVEMAEAISKAIEESGFKALRPLSLNDLLSSPMAKDV